MWADVLTKPLQGMAFKRMQAELMNCSVDYEEDDERETTLHTKSLSERGWIPSQTPQECVEGSTKPLTMRTSMHLGKPLTMRTSTHLGKPLTMRTNTHLGKDRQIEVSRIRKRSEHQFIRREENRSREVSKMLTFYKLSSNTLSCA
jgi:hypothetical protein